MKKILVERNLAALSDSASRASVPILLLMSASDCPYCELLKSDVLNPMEISGEYVDRVVIREFMIDGLLDVKDFGGASVPPRDVADRYDVSMTPTMLFLNTEGEEIGKRIVGITNIEFALYYVEKSIDQAIANF